MRSDPAFQFVRELEARTTSCGATNELLGRAGVLPCASFRASAAAIFPIILLFWSTDESSTRRKSEYDRFPQPATAMSSGTRNPASRMARMVPKATGSLKQKIPSGRFLPASNFTVAA